MKIRRRNAAAIGRGAGLALGALMVATAAARGTPWPDPAQSQTRLETLVQKEAEKIEGRVRATTLGALNPDTNEAITRWDLTVRQWKQEKGAGAAPYLAEGVLYDCLGRLQGVYTRQLSGELSRPLFADLAAARPGRAVKAFDAALKIDPQLLEARVRRARLRAVDDTQASRELERIADNGQPPLFAYLAAISRAEAARSQRNLPGVVRWYERALQLHPTSAAARIGIGAVKGETISLDGVDAEDPYYSYPCTILTSDVDAQLTQRLRNTAVK